MRGSNTGAAARPSTCWNALRCSRALCCLLGPNLNSQRSLSRGELPPRVRARSPRNRRRSRLASVFVLARLAIVGDRDKACREASRPELASAFALVRHRRRSRQSLSLDELDPELAPVRALVRLAIVDRRQARGVRERRGDALIRLWALDAPHAVRRCRRAGPPRTSCLASKRDPKQRAGSPERHLAGDRDLDLPPRESPGVLAWHGVAVGATTRRSRRCNARLEPEAFLFHHLARDCHQEGLPAVQHGTHRWRSEGGAVDRDEVLPRSNDS